MPRTRRRGDSRVAAVHECRGPPVSTAVDRQDFQEGETVRTSKGFVFRRDSDN